MAALVLPGMSGGLGFGQSLSTERRLIANINDVVDHSQISVAGDSSKLKDASGEDTTVSSRGDLGSRYVTPDLLTTKPVPFEPIEIPVPETAVYTGRLILRVYIGVFGNVDRVELVNSMLPDNYVDVAMQAIKLQRFLPGRVGGKAVPTFTDVEVEFNLPE